MSLPSKVKLVEVGPRDGLQNETQTIDITSKVQLIQQLADAGFSHIEAGSFVASRWVPQMADSAHVFERIARKPQVTYAALVPNLQGFEAALRAGVTEVAVFAAASEAFSQRNINCSIAHSLQRFESVLATAKTLGIQVRGYVSCVLGCPYQGHVASSEVVAVASELLAMGCYEISLGDTIGIGTARLTRQLIEQVAQRVPRSQLAGHFHDTYGQALTNVYASLLEGITVFDTSVAGLGGCPYAPGASGNVASEDVVYLLNGLGIETGIELPALIEVGQRISALLKRENGSKVGKALAK